MRSNHQVNVFDLVQVYVSIQSSGKPTEHFLVDDQFEFRHFILDIYRQIDRQTDRQTDGQTDRQIDRQKDRAIDSQLYRFDRKLQYVAL